MADPLDLSTCSYCGIEEHIHLLDGVLINEQDSGKLSCVRCYPEPDSWCPTGGVDHLELSIAPSLKPDYDNWKRTSRHAR